MRPSKRTPISGRPATSPSPRRSNEPSVIRFPVTSTHGGGPEMVKTPAISWAGFAALNAARAAVPGEFVSSEGSNSCPSRSPTFANNSWIPSITSTLTLVWAGLPRLAPSNG